MPSYKEDEGYCKACDKKVLIKKRRANHWLHLIISIVTGGLWWPVWVILTLVVNKRSVWKCSECGREIGLSQNRELSDDSFEPVISKPVKAATNEPGESESDVATKMRQLKELFDNGTLTEEEFKSSKEALLEQM